ncbi:uncharacterized protein LOC135928747 [Gordionus sp. m RMFG-2023]|uniref:uncharacterized protein LOC135928747 n=1 Tax=Gordionus sp. m RMFG-2023 TaxID=3053472 RepID=UPI0031FCC362
MSKCQERDLFPDPLYIYMDFEKSAMTTVKSIIGDHIIIRGCFYHLCQSTHRKIQKLGLESEYRTDETLSFFCGMMDGLAFVPLCDMDNAMTFLRSVTPSNGKDILDYFDKNYVNGVSRNVMRSNSQSQTRRIEPRFPPETWNVNQSTLSDEERTNNQCEGWNHRFSNLVGNKHPSIWVLIKKMKCEGAADETKLERWRVGSWTSKTKSQSSNNQIRLKKLCEEYRDGVRSLPDFIRAISFNIRCQPI